MCHGQLQGGIPVNHMHAGWVEGGKTSTTQPPPAPEIPAIADTTPWNLAADAASQSAPESGPAVAVAPAPEIEAAAPAPDLTLVSEVEAAAPASELVSEIEAAAPASELAPTLEIEAAAPASELALTPEIDAPTPASEPAPLTYIINSEGLAFLVPPPPAPEAENGATASAKEYACAPGCLAALTEHSPVLPC